MPYKLNGSLAGLIRPGSPTPMTNAEVRFYRLPNLDSQDLISALSANACHNFMAVSEEEVKGKSRLLVAEAKTNGIGQFEALFKEGYNGEALQLDVRFEIAPDGTRIDEDVEIRQFTLDIFQPTWVQRPEMIGAIHEVELPPNYWCRILESLGLWVIHGTVLDKNCENRVSNALVKACDCDLIQDDPLGEAITNREGNFTIYYREKEFKRTPLSPLVNSEPGSPDVYFTVQIPNSDIFLLNENRRRAREADRKDIPRCFYVRLCIEGFVGPPPPMIKPLFTHVGNFGIRTDFDENGLTKKDKCAFHNTIWLKGIIPDGGGDAWEYRFLFERVGGNMPEAKTNGVLDGTFIDPNTVIGMVEIERLDTSIGSVSFDYETIYVNDSSKAPNNVSPDSEGWISIPNINTETTVGSVRTTRTFKGNGEFLRFDTHKLFEKEIDLRNPSPAYLAGNALPAGVKQRPASPTYRITFEARLVGSTIPAYKESLDKIVISNLLFDMERHPYWGNSSGEREAVVMLDVVELKDGNGCDKIKKLTVNYTAYHPHIRSARLRLEGGNNLSVSLTPDSTGEVIGMNTEPFKMNELPPCAYIIWLEVDLNLADDENHPTPRLNDRIAICLDGPST